LSNFYFFQVDLPNCWRSIFLILPKLDGCQVDLPNCWSCSHKLGTDQFHKILGIEGFVYRFFRFGFGKYRTTDREGRTARLRWVLLLPAERRTARGRRHQRTASRTDGRATTQGWEGRDRVRRGRGRETSGVGSRARGDETASALERGRHGGGCRPSGMADGWLRQHEVRRVTASPVGDGRWAAV
jgi:hypothetical protein